MSRGSRPNCQPPFGPGPEATALRTFVLGGSDHPNHAVLARRLQGYLRWRNANAATPACWPPSGENAPASAENASNAGAAPGHGKTHDQTTVDVRRPARS